MSQAPAGGSPFTLNSSEFSNAGSAANDIFSGIEAKEGDDLKAEGLQVEASDYTEAAALATQNAEFTKQSTAVQQFQAHRNLEIAQGNTSAAVGASGGTAEGSAEDIIRGNAQQGAINKQILGQQGLITEAGYEEQAQSDTQLASYAQSSAKTMEGLGTLTEVGAGIGAALHIAGMVAAA